MVSRKVAHIALVVFDLFAIGGIFIGHQWLSEIFVEVNSKAEIIEFEKYTGYVFLGIVMPVLHICGIFETLRPKPALAYRTIIEKAFIVFSIILFASCIALMNWVPYKLEKEGYVYCQTASVRVASRIMIYTIDDEVCQELGPSMYKQLWDNVSGNQ